MRDHYETIRLLGAAVLGISSATPDEVAQSSHARTLPFALLSDPELTIIDRFGLRVFDEGEQRHVSRPAIYIADGDRTIRFAHEGDHPRDRPAIGSLLLALERLREELG